MKKERQSPSRIGEALLKFILPEKDNISLLGDYHELYKELITNKGRFKAELWYWAQIASQIPSSFKDSICFGGAMFKNMVKLTFRNLSKNRTFSFISVFGLSLAIGCFTVPYIFVDMSNSMNSFHENCKEIFYIEILINRSGSTQMWGPTPVPLGPSLINDFPQIKESVRIRPRRGTFRYKDKVFEESFLFVDEAFFKMFTFPLMAGEPDILKNKSAVVISDRYAEKYFGDENPIDKQLIVTHGEEYQRSFVVKGVVEKPPVTSSIQFDILLPYKGLVEWENCDFSNWGIWTHTFIRVEHPNDINIIKSGMDKYLKLQNAAEPDWPISSFVFEPLTSMSKNSYKVTNDIGGGPDPTAKIALLMFGILLLLLACFNYMNISIVKATRRLREIGIRKVLGSTRIKLVVQFLGENVVLCLFAIVIGACFAKFYLLPAFNSMFDAPLEMDFSNNHKLWLFLGFTFIITSLGSGGYPAFYVSRFRPVNILRRIQKVGGTSKLTKVLLTFQFIITFIMICTSLIFVKNAAYQKNIDWGYNQEQLISIRLDGEKHYEVFRNTVAQNPNIISIAGSLDHIGRAWDIDVAEYEGKKYEITRFLVGYDYLEAMQLRLIEGRLFDRRLATDQDQSIIINKKLVKNMAWQQPIGMNVVIYNTEYTVIGVVEDFHSEPFIDPIEPTLFRLCNKDEFSFITVRTKAGTAVQTAEYLEDTWKKLFPHESYQGFFQDDIWIWFFRENENINRLVSFVALVALVISCMGLFGLISVNIVKRMKEISIRKVLGASVPNITHLLNKDLFRIMILASIIAAPIGYFLNNGLLSASYEFHASITIVPFVVAGVVMILTSLITVFSQIYKAAKSNPIDTLRIE